MLCLHGAGCDRRTEPWVPLDQEPPRAERPVRIPGLGAPAPRNVAELLGSARSTEPSDPSRELSGTVALADGVSDSTQGTLFVIARGSAGGPPLAVKRLPPGPFPLRFVLGPGDVMMAGRPLEGEVSLAARLDRDGDPLTRGADDLVGAVDGSVRPGAGGLVIVLNAGGS